MNVKCFRIFLACFCFCLTISCKGEETVKFREDPDIQIRSLEKPFRVNKLNLLWIKARQRLSEPKLKSLYAELKMHDKDEIVLKHLKQENKDKDGTVEALTRKRLIGIMSSYDLGQHFEEGQDALNLKYKAEERDEDYKKVFKDKKLNKLWMKAELAGFNNIEMQALKEEFKHHQDKLDEYHVLMDDISGAKEQAENTLIDSLEEKLEEFNVVSDVEKVPKISFQARVNLVRNKGREVKDGFDRLERLAAQGANSLEFVEPKVQGLWRIAVASNFTADELSSIRTELHHYEKRLLKLRNLHAEATMNAKKEEKIPTGGKVTYEQEAENLIKKQKAKVDRLHDDLASRILAKSEL